MSFIYHIGTVDIVKEIEKISIKLEKNFEKYKDYKVHKISSVSDNLLEYKLFGNTKFIPELQTELDKFTSKHPEYEFEIFLNYDCCFTNLYIRLSSTLPPRYE